MSRHKFPLRATPFALPLIASCFFLVKATDRLSSRRSEGPSEYYKAQCVSCHGDQADLKFDPKLPDEELVRIVLKGKLVDVPPDMPAFEPKGVTPEQAKSLVTYMKELRKAAAN